MAAEDVLVSPAQLRARLEAGDAPLLLDVRWKLGDPDGRGHYEQGHIPGAVYVDLETELAAPGGAVRGRHPLPAIADLQRAARSWGLRAGQDVVVYDDLGGMSAARAWWLLRWAGVDSVRILDGAFSAWRRAGGAVEPGAVQVHETGDVVLSEGHLPALSADDAASVAADGVLLDARAGERYRGEVEPIDSRAGHIPGALSAPTAETLAADGSFLDEAALQARFASLISLGMTRAGEDHQRDRHPGAGDAADHQTVGVYCGSGVTAAHLAAALKIAGIEAALFPGSWSAWSSDPDRPVATGPTP